MQDIALAAALVILGELDRDLPGYRRLNLIVLSIMAAPESYDDERARRLEVSLN